ncbi:MAG: hypothetical protein E7462_01485 [Ruminococcaceae bacterium]|nr:hypothetical protein [Oscillospiraceae bacterium]
MKKIFLIIVCVLFLCGCAAPTFETVEDANDVPAMAKPATFLIDLPQEAAAPAMEGSSGKLYFCKDYDLAVEVLPSGNLDATMQVLTGFGRKDLDFIQTKRCGVDCYEGAWSSAGETGDQIGRFLILDDRSYHYCVSIMAASEDAGACMPEWNEILESVALAEG